MFFISEQTITSSSSRLWQQVPLGWEARCRARARGKRSLSLCSGAAVRVWMLQRARSKSNCLSRPGCLCTCAGARVQVVLVPAAPMNPVARMSSERCMTASFHTRISRCCCKEWPRTLVCSIVKFSHLENITCEYLLGAHSYFGVGCGCHLLSFNICSIPCLWAAFCPRTYP